jgi:hypothetical protein
MLRPKPILWTGSVLLASLGMPVHPLWAQDLIPPAPIAEAPMTLAEPIPDAEPARAMVGTTAEPLVPQYQVDPECETRPTRFQQWREQHRAKWRDKMWGYPSEFQRPPVGASVQYFRDQQKLNGRLSRMALYEYDFIPGTAEIKPRGREHLARISEWIPQTPGEISIEPTREGAELDEARRQAVYQELASLPCGVALVNIRTARRRHPGLDPDSGQLIFQNRMQQTKMRGVSGMGVGASLGAGMDAGGTFPSTRSQGN